MNSRFRPSRTLLEIRRINFSQIVAGALLLGAVVTSRQALAQGAPKLVSVTPADGATGVEATAPIVFAFDQEMDVTVPYFPSIPGSPIAGNFEIQPSALALQVSGTWSEDGRTFTVAPLLALPLDIAITWTLNPAGTLFPIKSKTGVALATISGSYTTGAGAPGPKLLSVTPADGATDVPVTTAVTFVFDQALKTDTAIGGFPPAVIGAVAWSGIGVDAGKFSYSWSQDGKSLTAEYAGDLPAHTQVNWQINPPLAAVKLENAAGQPVASKSGQFKTEGGVPGCDSNPFPDTWGSFALSKNSNFEQTSAADPGPVTDETAFVTSAMVTSPSAGPAFASGSLTRPNGTVNSLSALFSLGQYFETSATQAAQEAAFPPGLYTLRFMQTGQPERVVPMTMPPDNPPVPKITNFDEAQKVNAAADFTLRWNPFTAAGANDHISMDIADNQGNILFQAPDLCVPRELPVSATSIVIPANTLRADQTYNASLTFARVFFNSTNAVPQMAGFGSIVQSTQFTIKTGTGGNPGGTPATLLQFQLSSKGNPQFSLKGTAGQKHAIQRSGNVAGPTWQEVGTVTLDASGVAVFEDVEMGKVFPLFYRAVVK